MHQRFVLTVLFLAGILANPPGCTKTPPEPTPFDLAVQAVKEGKSKRIFTKDMPGVGDEQVRQLEGLEGLLELRLDGSSITGEALHSVMTLPNLVILSLAETQVNDDSLAILAKHPKLLYLSLDKTKITDQGLEHVAAIPNLGSLTLWRTAVSDNGCATLAKMSQLRSLSLDETRITRTGFRKLEALKNLKYLSIWRTAVTEDDAMAFGKAVPECKVNR